MQIVFAFPFFAKTALAAKHAVPKVREIFIYGASAKFLPEIKSSS